MRRTALLATVPAVVLLLPAGLAGAAPDQTGPGGPVPASPSAAAAAGGGVPRADLDRDHVSDDFEAELATADPSARLRVIVTGLGSAEARRSVGRFALRHELGLVNGFAAGMTAAQARALARHPGVRRVEEDGVVHALDDATDRDFGALAARADNPGLDGSGVGICVIDTGVDPTHEQIAPRTVRFVDYVNGRPAAYDDHGHGTHVAAIAAGDGLGGTDAATFRGVAPGADLFAAKVLDSGGSGAESDVAAAVQWCHEQPGVDVLSLSLGSPGGDGTDAVSLAVNRVSGADGGSGIGGDHDVVVVAAGNSGDRPGTISSPGVAAGAVTVGAVSDHSAPAGTARRDNGIWLAAFSSRGPTPDGRTKPDLAAPGVSVTSADAGTGSGYVTYSGTSMATPYVSGAVALGLEASPVATPAQVRSALTGSALDVGASGTDHEWGAGLLDVRAFVDLLAGDSTPDRTAFPTAQRVTGTVPTSGYVDIPIDIVAGDLGVPVAVTMTAGGQALCYWGCLVVEWSPDLDLSLMGPGGGVVARSDCALDGVSCGVGRQETIGYRPTVTGRYLLRVHAFTGSPNNGKGGPFTADIFRGPLSSGVPAPDAEPAPSNQPPVADAGQDRTVKINRRTKTATFTLDGSDSTDPDGTLATWSWREGSTGLGQGSKVTLTRGVGTYTFTLTVTDDDGAADGDSVVVTVRR